MKTNLAKYLITKYQVNSALKLQKLLFFIRVEELKNGKVLSDEFESNYNFEAWINGPVNENLYNEFRPYFLGLEEEESYLYNKNSHMEVYDKYIEKYVYKTPAKLVNLAKTNKGWIKAREGFESDKPCKNLIDEKCI